MPGTCRAGIRAQSKPGPPPGAAWLGPLFAFLFLVSGISIPPSAPELVDAQPGPRIPKGEFSMPPRVGVPLEEAEGGFRSPSWRCWVTAVRSSIFLCALDWAWNVPEFRKLLYRL